jgi:hypothetical protein
LKNDFADSFADRTEGSAIESVAVFEDQSGVWDHVVLTSSGATTVPSMTVSVPLKIVDMIRPGNEISANGLFVERP